MFCSRRRRASRRRARRRESRHAVGRQWESGARCGRSCGARSKRIWTLKSELAPELANLIFLWNGRRSRATMRMSPRATHSACLKALSRLQLRPHPLGSRLPMSAYRVSASARQPSQQHKPLLQGLGGTAKLSRKWECRRENTLPGVLPGVRSQYRKLGATCSTPGMARTPAEHRSSSYL